MRSGITIFLLLTIIFASTGFLLPGADSLNYEMSGISSQSECSLWTSQTPITNGDVRFGKNVRVIDHSHPYVQQVEPTLALLSTGRILVGWKEAQTHDGPGYRVGFAYSTDEGRTFSSNILMPPTVAGHRQSDPWLVVDNQDNAYFVFLDFGTQEDGIGVAKTVDGGETWLQPVQASDTPGFDDKDTACVDSEGNLYVVWDEILDPNNTLRLAKSTDGGTTFQPTTIVGDPYIPYITCTDNDTLFITTNGWRSLYGPGGDKIWITRSDDRGVTWTPQRIIIPPGYDEVGIITVVDTDSQNNVYVAYSAGTIQDKEIYLVKSMDGGNSWGAPVQINTVTTNMQRMVEMTIDDTDTIHVAWLDAQHDEWNIYYSYSEDGGSTFSSNIRVSSEGTSLNYWRPGDYFTMRTDSNNKAYIVWTDGRGVDQDIYFAKKDLEAPQIAHQPISSWYQNAPLTLTATVTDDDFTETVAIRYQLAGSTSWYTLIMTKIAENIYQGTIPAHMVVGSSLIYYLTAQDAAGRESQLTNGAPGFAVSLNPISPSLIFTLIGSAIVLTIVIISTIWYLRRKPRNSSAKT